MARPAKPELLLTRRATFACPHCRRVLGWRVGSFISYFRGERPPCPACGTALDLWQVFVDELEYGDAFGGAAVLIGGTQMAFRLQTRAHETVEVNLVRHGVPKDAVLLNLNVTPIGGAGPDPFPLLRHSNRAHPVSVGSRFWLHHSAPPGSVAEGEASISLVWVARDKHSIAVQSLFDAIGHFVAGDHAKVMVPANVAAEASVYRVVERGLAGCASAENLKNFLSQAATYSHQLNVLLNVLADARRVPRLPDSIRGQLNRLRNLRNDLAHTATTKAKVDGRACAEFIAAAFFAIQYVAMLEKRMRSRQQR